MKRGLLIIGFLLILLPFVNADYDGAFSMDKSSVQLGDEFTIIGDNIQFDGQKYNGNAMIIFEGYNESFTLLTEISEGEFSYVSSFCQLQDCVLDKTSGDFKITIQLFNLQLEALHEFTHILTINVVDKLDIALNLKESQLIPGEDLELEGSVFRKVDSAPVTNMDLKINIDDYVVDLLLNSESFEYDTALSNKIVSNYHDVLVTAEDIYGNWGNNTISFYVTPVPTWIESRTSNGTEFSLGESLEFTIQVYDQANAPISKEVSFKIKNSNGKTVLKDSAISGQDITYDLGEYPLPGEWIIEADSEDLESEMFFYIEEVKDLEVTIDEYSIIVKNVGNVYYQDNLVLVSQEGDQRNTISRRTNLEPGEEMVIDMYTMFDVGRKNLMISNTNEEFDVLVEDPRSFFTKVGDTFSEFTGQAIMSSGSGTSNAPTFVLIIFFVVGLLVFSYRLRKGRKGLVPSNKRFKFLKFKKKKSRDDVDDLKDRILKDIEDSQKHQKEEVKKESVVSPMPSIFDKDFSKVSEPKSKSNPSRVDFDKPYGSKE